MTFSPVVPVGGYAGWTFLNRTLDSQKTAFAKSPQMQRDISYFRERIGAVKTADDLVADRRLLSVALGAFGLQDDINSTFFIRKVLADGTKDATDLANRLTDKRYKDLARTFAFDAASGATRSQGFAEKIIAAYTDREFERALGTVDSSMRLALNARRELADIAAKSSSEDTKWYLILGSSPLRNLFQIAFGLPSAFSAADLDQQLGVLKERASRYLGSEKVSQFNDVGKVEDLIRMFITRNASQSVTPGATGPGVALAVLTGSRLSLRV